MGAMARLVEVEARIAVPFAERSKTGGVDLMSAAATFYEIDGRRMSFKEHRKHSLNVLLFAVSAVAKALRVPLCRARCFPRVESIGRLEAEQVPVEAREALAPLIEECERAGMKFCFHFQFPTQAGIRSCSAALLSADRLTVALACYGEARAAPDRLILLLLNRRLRRFAVPCTLSPRNP